MSKKVPLLQGYAKAGLMDIKTNPKNVVNLPPKEAWKTNLLHSKLVTEAIRDAAFKLKYQVDSVKKELIG